MRFKKVSKILVKAVLLPFLAFMAVSSASWASDARIACASTPNPVKSISATSVYKQGDPTQSHIDESANADYRASMAPVWDFVKQVSEQASSFQRNGDKAAGECAIQSLAQWARAGAFSDLATQSVRLNFGRNLSGISLAYVKVRGVASAEDRSSIEAWLRSLAQGIPSLFQSISATDTAKGNLRYWNGLAAMSVGEIVADASLIEWGDESMRIGLCQADADGALPIEMHRASRALFYQLYATTPLVAMAVHAKARGANPEKECGGALLRIVSFSVRSATDPSLVEAKARVHQDTGPYRALSSAFAWIDLYKPAFGEVPGLAGTPVNRPLSDAALGGLTTTRN